MISGKTSVLAHLGYPTESFKAPMIYNPYFEKRGIDAVCIPLGCKTEDYAAFFRLLFRLSNVVGALVTMPHKMATVALLDEASTSVRISGSCNAVRVAQNGKLVGDMFDGEGFVRGLKRRGRTLRNARALVIGSGGVGSAIAVSLAEHGIAELGVYDRSKAAMHRLADRMSASFPHLPICVGSNDPFGWDVVVNATPLGMNEDDPLPLDVSRIDPGTFVGEVVMSREVTPLLAAARKRGCDTQIGLDMLFEQIPAYLEFFGFPSASPDELRSLACIRY